MISTKPAPTEYDAWTDNIIDAYYAATDDQRERGRQWYPVARDVAELIGQGDVETGAGVLAALSPQQSWPENVRLAGDAMRGHVHGHVADALTKVRRILAGDYPSDVLPPERKTGQFYRCIVDPADATAVVIDRHAHDVAINRAYGNDERGLSSQARYDALADCYLAAASVVGEPPSVVQATVWVAWKDRIAGTSTRGPVR